MPLFADRSSANAYTNTFYEYCRLLTEAGLRLPSQQTVIIEVPGRPATLYIAQEKLPAARFAHQLIHEFESDLIPPVVELINRRLASDQVPVTIDAVNKYYCEDKLIWTLAAGVSDPPN
jgi:hypothetical protein